MSCHACLGKYAPEAQPLLAAKKEEAAGRSPARIFKDYVHNAALMAIPAPRHSCSPPAPYLNSHSCDPDLRPHIFLPSHS